MMRVLCVVASLNTGGAETFLMKVLRSIDKSKYMLDFIVSAPGVYDEEVRLFGGKIYNVPLRTEHPIKTFLAIKKNVKQNNYDYFLKLCDTPIGIADILAAKLGGAKRISVRSCNSSSNASKIKEFMYKVIRPWFNALIDCKIAPSVTAAQYTFGRNMFERGTVHILNNGVDLEIFRYDEEARAIIRNELKISEDMFLVGHIGRFNEQKNHKFLIEVFSEFYKTHENSRLLLVGTGELENQVKAIVKQLDIADAVIFMGIRSDIPQILSAIDIFLLPSFYEGMPNTVIEAQATGLKCLISDNITSEANITGNVEYLSISKGVDCWLDAINKQFIENNPRVSQKQAFLANGYEINEVNKKFTNLVFGEERE